MMNKEIMKIKESLDKGDNQINDSLSNDYLAKDVLTIKVVRSTYVDEFINCKDVLISYLEKKDYQKILDYVHRIKGVSLYIGANNLYELSSFICDSIRNNLECFDEVMLLIELNEKIITELKDKI